VFRLIGGSDFGVRGLFAAEASAASTNALLPGNKNVAPGDWTFAVRARASGIHRWDLTERDDNPRVGIRVNGRWNPGAGTMDADEITVESPHSNLRGTASLKNVAESSLEVRMDSAGIQAADLLAWYRAFRQGGTEEIRATQYFTGAANFRGWPLSLNELAFSSPGGRWTVPGFIGPVEVRAMRGGTQKQKLFIEPFGVNIPAGKTVSTSAKVRSPSSNVSGGSFVGATANLSLAHDFDAKAGGIRIEGQAARIQDIFGLASAFGRPLQIGWELRGQATADLRWDWSAGSVPAWNGCADVAGDRVRSEPAGAA
jgi:hypothetical protein